ncbi:hypothetical protein MNBD_GAMMA03-317 [hydrothermal vent metagenome]|uniref:HTH luxR-type domain-containing protein n=1 Tax=hydrothermal vent metagenome TaxID=652676 RepID=A0A3B0WDI7_9ZZZZ
MHNPNPQIESNLNHIIQGQSLTMQTKRPLIFTQTPNALKNWLTACGSSTRVIYDLTSLVQKNDPSKVILLIQISQKANLEAISQLCQKKFEILAFSNTPTNAEGLFLFKNGIKGYLNTYATVEIIQQALNAIQAGNIWLGQDIMQAMIGQLGQTPIKTNEWQNLLTYRENQVVQQVLNKKSNREIAAKLNITERTVKSHLHNIFRKLHVSDRLDLALKIHNW